jgi:hypothetical protein
MQHVITVHKEKDLSAFVQMAKIKFGITNERVICEKKRLAQPPALISFSRGRILYQGLWIDSAESISETYGYIWKSYGNEYTNEDFHILIENFLYQGNWAYITQITRSRVEFKDGSVITGEIALELFYRYEKKHGKIYYFQVEDYFTEQEVYGDKITFRREEPTGKEMRYEGTSSLSLYQYTLPIINRTPFALKLASGYSTVANGAADTIWVHPGNTLRETVNGDAYSFSIWRERPTRDTDIGTVLEYDEEFNEIVQSFKKEK